MAATKVISKKIGARQHHLDQRAHLIAGSGEGHPDDILTTRELAAWLEVSTQFLEIGRCKGYGPPWIAYSRRSIRYRRRDVLLWLDERTRSHTSAAA